MHLRIFAYTSNTLIASFVYMDCMLTSGKSKNFRFLLNSYLFTERAPVMKVICSTLQPSHCIVLFMSLQRDTYWSSTVIFAVVRYRSQTSDICLCSRILDSSVFLLCKGTLHFPISFSVPYSILCEVKVLNTLNLGWYIIP